MRLIRQIFDNRLLRFALAGLPAFVVAVPLNWALVTMAGLAKPGAYAIVLACQVLVNFFICYYLVFDRGDEPLLRQLWKFSAGILVFRLLDWLVYSAGTRFLGVPFLLMQIVNVVVFVVAKYLFARRVMARQSEPMGIEQA